LKYLVAVRTLCEFAAKEGDLDLRFTPGPSAQDGIAGHATVALRRGAGYESEVTLSGEYRQLQVRGRADGFDATRRRVEEVKTFRGDLAAMPHNHRQLHWAQAKVYGWLLCQERGLAEIDVALVYFDVGTQRETVLAEAHTAAELQAFFERLCERFLQWALREIAHRAARNAALAGLRFPHDDFRPGQRQLAEAVYKAARSGRCLMAQAPTGIGKTIGTVFPLLKACDPHAMDKVFFLTAKGSGRGLALEALQRIQRSQPGLPLRALELVARDKACEHPDKACHGASCPLARGFYDRLPAARDAAVQLPLLDKATLRGVALAHEVCPYYLGQELARWSDVVVGDYNHFFDLHAMLHGLTVANDWRVAVLVDEAHNLVQRARQMYSAELSRMHLQAARRVAPAKIKRALGRVQREWPDAAEDYAVLPEVPSDFSGALQQAVAAITEHQIDHPEPLAADLQRFYFDALHFGLVLELFDHHSLFDITLQGGDSRLCLRNIVPAPFLAGRFKAAHTSTLFSATLSPQHFYADTLGLAHDTAWIDVDSPFRAEQLAVKLVTHISTRYQRRDASLAPIAELIAAQYAARPGNYLAFFSSFDYLAQVAQHMALRQPEVPLWQQPRRIGDAERDAFLARFHPDGRGVGFAVLGGVFGEGIDLPGRRLIGAFVATLGLPQINPVNEQMRERMGTIFGAGYDYTYLYPGLQKVVQAAGRVIRTPEDEGVLFLIDDRFGRADVRRLLPGWWQPSRHEKSPARAGLSQSGTPYSEST
jgi:DNA excision repair protein ERCC-2